jgi:DNA-binding transcriptional LysR family regulator
VAGLAPLIFNETPTHMYRMTMAWFADAGFTPRARIELNYSEAIKSLVAAGYGAAVLPREQSLEEPTCGTTCSWCRSSPR